MRQPKDPAKWGICQSCKQNRYIVSRGLCMGCWKIPEIRDRHRDKRLVARNPITPEQYEILNDPKYAEPRKLFFLAWRRVVRYGPRIQVDDLIQIGYLVMLKCVKDYDTNWHNSLFRFCKRGIASEMERHCYNELRSSTAGNSHEDFVDFIKNDYQQSLIKFGTRFHLGMTFNVTDHALQRYRERFNPTGTRKELRKYVEYSTRLPYERELIWLTHKENPSMSNEIREYDAKDMIIVMGPALHGYSKQQQVITVINRKESAIRRRGKD